MRLSLPFSDANERFRHILQSIDHIDTFVKDKSFEDYLSDRMLQSAVERELLIVSEAAIKIGPEIEVLCPGPDWPNIRGIGNAIRHAYEYLENVILWNTVCDDLGPLREAVQKALEKL